MLTTWLAILLPFSNKNSSQISERKNSMEYRGEGRGGAQANNLLKSMINHKERYS